MEVRADKFLSGHYAYFVELPERKEQAGELEMKVLGVLEKPKEKEYKLPEPEKKYIH